MGPQQRRMSILLPFVTPHASSIRNIIFDFGGVICDIDPRFTVEKFKAFGPAKEGRPSSPEETGRMFEKLVEVYETGKITSAEFRDAIREHYALPLSDERIDEAWNALLLEIPEGRIRLIEEARKDYRLFLLSNSNEIHYHCYAQRLTDRFGYAGFDDLFEKAWFSYRTGLSKPDPEIFRLVLDHHRLVPSETLFIDDTLKHVRAAESIGIQGYHLKPGEDIRDLFA